MGGTALEEQSESNMQLHDHHVDNFGLKMTSLRKQYPHDHPRTSLCSSNR